MRRNKMKLLLLISKIILIASHLVAGCSGQMTQPCSAINHIPCYQSKENDIYTCFDRQAHFCCNGTIHPHDGIAGCCSGARQVYNTQSEICCGRAIRGKESVTTECCNDTVYNSRYKKCCRGRLHEKPAAVAIMNARCCGDEVYDRTASQCCRVKTGGREVQAKGSCARFRRTYQPQHVQCGAETFNPTRQVCCTSGANKYTIDNDGHVACCSGHPQGYINKTGGLCCNGEPHVGVSPSQECCGTSVIDSETQRCCWSPTDPLGPQPYDSQQHQCCAGRVVDRGLPCCFNETFNPAKKLCCNNSVYALSRYSGCKYGIPIERTRRENRPRSRGCLTPDTSHLGNSCCDGRPFFTSRQTCCNGTLFNQSGLSCCCDQAYRPWYSVCRKADCTLVSSPLKRPTKNMGCPLCGLTTGRSSKSNNGNWTQVLASGDVIVCSATVKRKLGKREIMLLQLRHVSSVTGPSPRHHACPKQLRIWTRADCDCNVQRVSTKYIFILGRPRQLKASWYRSTWEYAVKGPHDAILKYDRKTKRQIRQYLAN